MATTHSLIALGGIALVFARVGFALGAGRRRFVYAALAFALAWVPLEGLPLAGYVRGLTGDLSVTTLVLVALGFWGGIEPMERRAISVLVVVGALFLYPMALGLSSFDPYRLGFGPSALHGALFVLSIVAWLHRYDVLLLVVALGVSGYALGLMESANLWDHVLDPWVALASIYDLRSFRRNS